MWEDTPAEHEGARLPPITPMLLVVKHHNIANIPQGPFRNVESAVEFLSSSASPLSPRPTGVKIGAPE